MIGNDLELIGACVANHNFPIIALDSLNFKNASKNHYGNTGYLMMPCFSENIRPHINQLEKDNNLLRFVMSPPETNIDSIVEIAQKTKRCLHILIHNLLEVINEKSPMLLRMPAADKN